MADKPYADTAYFSAYVPKQADAPSQPWIQKLAQIRLPWGGIYFNIAPSSLFGDDMSPNIIRLKEQYKQQLAAENQKLKEQAVVPLDKIANNQINDDINHQHFIYRPAPKWIRFGLFIEAMGKVCVPTFGVIFILLYFLLMGAANNSWAEYNFMMFNASIFLFTPLLLCWLIGYIIANKLPSSSARTRRPKWEFNRQTGMVTTYTKKDSFTAPFYEWDAYINVMPSHAGTFISKLYLAHRYKPQVVDLSILAPMGSQTEELYATWDFIQNYMDTVLGLPDIPLLEEFRPFDLRSIEMDAITNRDPHYWLNMSDEDWCNQQIQMHHNVININTTSRQNAMADSVNYAN